MFTALLAAGGSAGTPRAPTRHLSTGRESANEEKMAGAVWQSTSNSGGSRSGT